MYNAKILNKIYYTNMRKLIILSIILIFAQQVYAENIYSGLSKIENQLFRQTYEYELPETRMERVETKLFGTCQTGTINDRYNLAKTAIKNYKAYNTNYNNRERYYSQYRPPIFTGSTGSNWKNMLWGNFMNQFAGYPTGMTPAIGQGMDPAYMDYFEAERAGYDKYYSNPRGYYVKRKNGGARSSVTILD